MVRAQPATTGQEGKMRIPPMLASGCWKLMEVAWIIAKALATQADRRVANSLPTTGRQGKLCIEQLAGKQNCFGCQHIAAVVV